MILYLWLGALILFFIVLKYYQFKSCKYLKEEYEYMIGFMLFITAYIPSKYYKSKIGIKYKNLGAIIFVLGSIFSLIILLILYSMKIIN